MPAGDAAPAAGCRRTDLAPSRADAGGRECAGRRQRVVSMGTPSKRWRAGGFGQRGGHRRAEDGARWCSWLVTRRLADGLRGGVEFEGLGGWSLGRLKQSAEYTTSGIAFHASAPGANLRFACLAGLPAGPFAASARVRDSCRCFESGGIRELLPPPPRPSTFFGSWRGGSRGPGRGRWPPGCGGRRGSGRCGRCVGGGWPGPRAWRRAERGAGAAFPRRRPVARWRQRRERDGRQTRFDGWWRWSRGGVRARGRARPRRERRASSALLPRARQVRW